MAVEPDRCPFCGKFASAVKVYRKSVKSGSGVRVSNIRGARVMCTECLAMSGIKETEEKAVEAWNRRDGV